MGEPILMILRPTQATFFCIVATEDTVLASLTSNIDNIADICTGQDATTLSANTAIYGRITGITLTSGAVIAYKM